VGGSSSIVTSAGVAGVDVDNVGSGATWSTLVDGPAAGSGSVEVSICITGQS
jgi:hypothetical protein